jgi:multicomponent Na+:H+ antiporter subunit E
MFRALSDVPLRVLAGTFVVRLAGFGLLWWVLAGGRFDEPILVAGIVLAAVATSMALWPPASWKWHPVGLLQFVPFFVKVSVLGGWDVARRAFDPSGPVDPGFVDVDLTIRSEPARVFLTWVTSLVPGTAAARLEGRRLTIHVIDRSAWNEAAFRKLEHRVSKLFHSETPPHDRTHSPGGSG